MLHPRFKNDNKNDETRRLMDSSESDSEGEIESNRTSSWNFFSSCMPPTGNMFRSQPKKWNYFQSMLDPQQSSVYVSPTGTPISQFDPKQYFCFHPIEKDTFLTVDDMIKGIFYFWNIDIQEHSFLYEFLMPCLWNGMSKSEFTNRIKNMVELHLDHVLERNSDRFFTDKTQSIEYILDFIGDAVKDSTTLKTLSLKHNDIQEYKPIARILKENKSITRLNLYGNKIDWYGMTALAFALRNNSTLTHIDVRNNAFSSSKTSYRKTKSEWMQLVRDRWQLQSVLGIGKTIQDLAAKR